MYTAVVLMEKDQLLLKWIARALLRVDERVFRFETAHGVMLPHHMTINLGSFDPELNDPAIKDRSAELLVEEMHIDDELGICAAPVVRATCLMNNVPVKSMNIVPHITICLRSGVKPMVSNQLLEAKLQTTQIVRITEPCILHGVICETN